MLEQYLYRSRCSSPSVIDKRGRFDGGELAIVYSSCIENPHIILDSIIAALHNTCIMHNSIILDSSEADVGFLTRKLLEKEFFILFTNC